MKPHAKASPLLFITRILLLVAAYFARGGGLRLNIPYVGSNITLFWPPSGIALAGTACVGAGILWPGILLGVLTVNLTTGNLALPVALEISLSNTAGTELGALLLRHAAGFRNGFIRGRDVTAFLLIGPVCMLLTASAGVFALHASGNSPMDLISQAWLGWWLGDTVGILVFTPLLLFGADYRMNSIFRFSHIKLSSF